MSDNVDDVMAAMDAEARGRAERAFKQGVQLAGELAGQLCPVGYYGARRGKAGKSGGDLKLSLVAEYLGESGGEFQARFSSPLAYAWTQHEIELHHPGLYTGRPGERYAAKFFSRAIDMIFVSGNDPQGRYAGAKPATFQELLDG